MSAAPPHPVPAFLLPALLPPAPHLLPAALPLDHSCSRNNRTHAAINPCWPAPSPALLSQNSCDTRTPACLPRSVPVKLPEVMDQRVLAEPSVLGCDDSRGCITQRQQQANPWLSCSTPALPRGLMALRSSGLRTSCHVEALLTSSCQHPRSCRAGRWSWCAGRAQSSPSSGADRDGCCGQGGGTLASARCLSMPATPPAQQLAPRACLQPTHRIFFRRSRSSRSLVSREEEVTWL